MEQMQPEQKEKVGIRIPTWILSHLDTEATRNSIDRFTLIRMILGDFARQERKIEIAHVA